MTPDKRAIVSCRTGARASVTHVTPRLTGYDNVTLAGLGQVGQDSKTPKEEGARRSIRKRPCRHA